MYRLHHRRGQDGAAAVEFAIVFVFVLAPLLFGTLQYGFYFWSKSASNSAVREGARRSSVGDVADCTAFKALVIAEGGGAIPGSATVGRTFTKATGNTGSGGQRGDAMSVTLSFPAFDTGLIPLPAGGMISSAITTRVEYVSTTSLATC